MKHSSKAFITEMEKRLNEMEKLSAEISTLNEKWKNHLAEFKTLTEYYQSEQWHTDFEASNADAYSDIPCGVLSEDAVYNLFISMRENALEIIKTAVSSLEN